MMDSKDLSPKVSPTHRKTLAQEMTHADKMFERAALIKVFNALDDDGNGVLTTGEVFKMLSYGAAKGILGKIFILWLQQHLAPRTLNLPH